MSMCAEVGAHRDEPTHMAVMGRARGHSCGHIRLETC